MKRVSVAVAVLCSLFLLALPALAAPAGIVINGCRLGGSAPPVIQEGQVYLPLRSVATALGAGVGWDPATATATVTKNGMVLTVNTRDASMQLDGRALGGTALLTNGQILVPAQALEKAMGATVTLDTVSGNVYIGCQQTVDGMTPEQLLNKADAAAKKYKTYKFTQNITVTTKGPGQSLTMPMQIQGSVEAPDRVYTVSTTSLFGKKITSGAYVDDGRMYVNMNGSGWQEMPLSVSVSSVQQRFGDNPADDLAVIEQVGGIISAMTPQTVDGTTFDVVRVTLDPARFQSWLANTMSAAAAPGQNQAQVQKAVQGIMDLLQIKDVAFEMFINPKTYLMQRGYLTMEMDMDMPGASMTMTEHGSFTQYDFGQPVQMPQIPVGK